MNKRTKEALRRRVRNGIALLNQVRPSWHKDISVKQLDLASCELCVLGQLYAHEDEDGYARGLKILNGRVQKNPAKFGFAMDSDLSADYFDYPILNEIWAEEIATQRRIARMERRLARSVNRNTTQEVAV